jgi:hypothetical protein
VWGELGRFADALGHEVFVADRDTDLYVQARRSSRRRCNGSFCPVARAHARSSPSVVT